MVAEVAILKLLVGCEEAVVMLFVITLS